MPKIVYLPLDERPCNAKYPLQIAAASDLRPVAPPSSLLGYKKRAADTTALAEWLAAQASDADYLIVSLDMLVYGGIVPSRLHQLSLEECRSRLRILTDFKTRNPKLQIFAFNLIMRAPAYDGSDEEPDYYAECGARLARNGWLQDKDKRDRLTESERLEWGQLITGLPNGVLADFTGRRRTNASVNRMSVTLVEEGTIDFLVIPLDDNAEYGYSSSEQRELLFLIEEKSLMNRVHMYPGADEVGCTLFARVFCEVKQYHPSAFVRYSATHGPSVIPKYEDRSLAESVKSQITAAGGWIGDSSGESDFILLVNAPPVGQDRMAETKDRYAERHAAYFTETNLREFAQVIRRYSDQGRIVALADVAVCNGADEPLMKLLAGMGLLPRLTAYAGWNTSGNTLGTVIAHAIVASYYRRHTEEPGNDERLRQSEAFYLSRLVEDWGYQAVIRWDIVRGHLESIGANYFDVAAVHDQVAGLIRLKMEDFLREFGGSLEPERIRIDSVTLPWNRMFEVGFDLRVER